jgi:hypothetical protein
MRAREPVMRAREPAMCAREPATARTARRPPWVSR